MSVFYQAPPGVGFPQSHIQNISNTLISLSGNASGTPFLTIPAGRIWNGSLTIECAIALNAGATNVGIALGTVQAVGLGTFARCAAYAGGSGGSGTEGAQAANSITIPSIWVAGGNGVVVTVSATIAGAVGEATFMANGMFVQ